jgi:hypothetical protein
MWSILKLWIYLLALQYNVFEFANAYKFKFSQGSWLQIQRSGFDSQCYQIFWVVGLEWSPLSLMSTIEDYLKKKIAAPV